MKKSKEKIYYVVNKVDKTDIINNIPLTLQQIKNYFKVNVVFDGYNEDDCEYWNEMNEELDCYTDINDIKNYICDAYENGADYDIVKLDF